MVHMSLTEEITFLNNDQVENAEVGINNATADRLALALASPAGTVAGVALAEQQAHTAVGQYTLFHGEALLVVASADAHHIALHKYRKPDINSLLFIQGAQNSVKDALRLLFRLQCIFSENSSSLSLKDQE